MSLLYVVLAGLPLRMLRVISALANSLDVQTSYQMTQSGLFINVFLE